MTTAAAIAMVTTPAFAADLYTPTYVPPINDPVYKTGPAVVGHLSMGIGIVDINTDDFSDFDNTLGIFTGAGRANVNLGNLNVQAETGGFALFKDGESYSAIGVAGHLWTRLNGAAVGAYVAANFPTGATIGTVGVEGEAYFGNITVGGNAGYNWSDNAGDFWNIAGWADFYFTPDFRVGGTLAYADGDFGDGWGAAVDAEYRFSGTPFSGWAEVAYSDTADIWSGLLGIRIFMDAPSTTLQQHDQEVPWDTGLLGRNILNF